MFYHLSCSIQRAGEAGAQTLFSDEANVDSSMIDPEKIGSVIYTDNVIYNGR